MFGKIYFHRMMFGSLQHVSTVTYTLTQYMTSYNITVYGYLKFVHFNPIALIILYILFYFVCLFFTF
jgi:hypothetical protein